MTDIDRKSAEDSTEKEEERCREEIRRVSDGLAHKAMQDSSEPTVQICALGLAFLAVCKHYSVSWSQLRSQLENFWRAMGKKVDKHDLEVVSPDKFERIIRGGK